MKIRLLALSVLLSLLSGCVTGQERERVYTRDCNGNEYWDGHQCRFRGSGGFKR